MASPLFDLTGKVAVVTGSSKGIGKSIALHLALQGAKVVVSSRKQPACEEAAAEIRKAGGQAIVIPCNISDKAQCQNLIAETKKQLGPVDVLVCNAATNPYYGPTDKMPDEAFTKIMQNNILSNIWLINLCVPDMRAKKNGSVIIVSSIGGVRASTVIGAYCISKAADMQLARNLAAELGPDNIRVNTIAPGWSGPTSPRRCGTIRSISPSGWRRRRCGASASPTISAASPSCWRARPAPSSPARPSSPMRA